MEIHKSLGMMSNEVHPCIYVYMYISSYVFIYM